MLILTAISIKLYGIALACWFQIWRDIRDRRNARKIIGGSK